MARQYDNAAAYQGPDGLWHFPYVDPDTGERGEDLGYDPPQTDYTPSPQTPAIGANGQVQVTGTYRNGSTVPWNDPRAIGAGTASVPYGQGVPGFGQAPLTIRPEYLSFLNDPNVAPGYIPGSGTYNQYRLDQPGLFGQIAGVNSNLRYGLGGTGDPTTGREPQTPQEWVDGGKLFTWQGNLGQTDATRGLDYIATLFGRSDTASGIGTATWSAPKQYWDGLAQAVASGAVQPTNRGWAALAAKGYTPGGIGGAAVQQAASVGVQASGQGASGSSGAAGAGSVEGLYGNVAAANASSQAADLALRAADLAMRKTYNDWLMRTGDDKAARDAAQQAWQNEYNTRQLEAQQTGYITVDGQKVPTLARQGQEQSTALSLLGLGAQLRGPQDYGAYLRTLNSTPQGLRDLVGALGGQYQMSGFTGAPKDAQYTPASVAGLVNEMSKGAASNEAADFAAATTNLPGGQAWDANNVAKLRQSPTQWGVLQSLYSEAGRDFQDEYARFLSSLPAYQGPRVGAVRL